MSRSLHLFALSLLLSTGFLVSGDTLSPFAGAPPVLAGGCGSGDHAADRDADTREDNTDAGYGWTNGREAPPVSRQAWRIKRRLTKADKAYKRRMRRITLALIAWWSDTRWGRKPFRTVEGDLMMARHYVLRFVDYAKMAHNARAIRRLSRKTYNRLVLKIAMIEGSYGDVIRRFRRILPRFDYDARLKERLGIVIDSAERLSGALDKYVYWQESLRALGKSHVATVRLKKAWEAARDALPPDERRALKSGGSSYMNSYKDSHHLHH